jgi:hypothetical protein
MNESTNMDFKIGKASYKVRAQSPLYGGY